MPEMTFSVRWPDDSVQQCYSPSLVIHDHLTIGERYTVADFRLRAINALSEAAERVRVKFGFACTSAAASAEIIDTASRAFADTDTVEIVAMQPPLPRSEHRTPSHLLES